ncbi:MAG: ATP-binding protein [Candidatus Riflebacteria bacterium]|nr:ATP-binding protein [Candidatus Riflebacteria bacterium]
MTRPGAPGIVDASKQQRRQGRIDPFAGPWYGPSGHGLPEGAGPRRPRPGYQQDDRSSNLDRRIDGFETLRRVRQTYPAIKTALITDYSVDGYIRMALEKDVTNIIAKTAPFDAEELLRTVDNLVSGARLFGLANYMDPEADLSSHRLRGSDEIQEIRNACLQRFSRTPLGESDISLFCVVFEEIVSNALYHAYGYRKGDSVRLAEGQTVSISYGSDRAKIGLSVVDLSGRLTKETVLEKIIGATDEDGLLAGSGRGLFLSRAMSDRLIVNILMGKKTELIALKYFAVTETVNRPLYINQI